MQAIACASKRAYLHHLFVVEGGNTWKDLALQKFQGGTSSGGNVRHVSGTSRLFRGSHRVTSSNDGNGTLFLGQVGENVDNAHGSGSKRFEFKHSHRSVHAVSWKRKEAK